MGAGGGVARCAAARSTAGLVRPLTCCPLLHGCNPALLVLLPRCLAVPPPACHWCYDGFSLQSQLAGLPRLRPPPLPHHGITICDLPHAHRCFTPCGYHAPLLPTDTGHNSLPDGHNSLPDAAPTTGLPAFRARRAEGVPSDLGEHTGLLRRIHGGGEGGGGGANQRGWPGARSPSCAPPAAAPHVPPCPPRLTPLSLQQSTPASGCSPPGAHSCRTRRAPCPAPACVAQVKPTQFGVVDDTTLFAAFEGRATSHTPVFKARGRGGGGSGPRVASRGRRRRIGGGAAARALGGSRKCFAPCQPWSEAPVDAPVPAGSRSVPFRRGGQPHHRGRGCVSAEERGRGRSTLMCKCLPACPPASLPAAYTRGGAGRSRATALGRAPRCAQRPQTNPPPSGPSCLQSSAPTGWGRRATTSARRSARSGSERRSRGRGGRWLLLQTDAAAAGHGC